ncbi:MAG: RNA-binding S4 domain-containing protein [Proteobacteria bacterium]|nr:RNA-binding S4 domain-containing protein [Pseudomonadota bacterium]
MEQEFELKGEYIELVKLLKVTGLCQTGGEAKMVTGDGLVKVDGEVETRKKKKIRLNQVVEYEGNTIKVV